MRDQPVSAWEALLASVTDPKEREHIEIAIAARKRLEAQHA